MFVAMNMVCYKLVNRYEFSRANFNNMTAWSGRSA